MPPGTTYLEVAHDLTTGSFISTLRRFLAVRGNATKVIFSDNATNFLGARAELQRLSLQGVIGELASHVRGALFGSIVRPWPVIKVEFLSR